MASRTVVGRAFSSNDDCSYHSALVAKYGIATVVGCLEQLQGGGWLGQLRYAGNFWWGSRANVGLHSQPPACKGRTRASTTESGVPRQLKNSHLKCLTVTCSTEQGSCLLAYEYSYGCWRQRSTTRALQYEPDNHIFCLHMLHAMRWNLLVSLLNRQSSLFWPAYFSNMS